MKTLYLTLPFQSVFSITTDCPELTQSLSVQYGAYLKLDIDRQIDFHISIIKTNNKYCFITHNGSHLTEHPIYDTHRFIFENNVYHPSVFALHGAALEWQGQGYLFLAPTTGGKTTLTAFLSEQGFGYLTDDCILLRRSDFYIHPNTTPLHLRAGGLEILKQYNITLSHKQPIKDNNCFRRWIYTPLHCIHTPTPLKSIYFIKRNNIENQCIPMNATEKIAELMKSPITQYPINKEYIQFISRLSKVDCFRLHYKDMKYVKELIQYGTKHIT